MVSKMRSLLLLTGMLLINCGGQGTETGNPVLPNSYSNDDFGVATQYDANWNATEGQPPAHSSTPSSPSAPADTPADATGTSGGIDISNAPFTRFTDGTTTVTIYYVTVSSTTTSLPAYLRLAFPTRSFATFSNTRLSGYKYDNPEAGAAGGDLQEYYFLKGTTLLYVVTDLFATNNGTAKFDTLLDSLRFK